MRGHFGGSSGLAVVHAGTVLDSCLALLIPWWAGFPNNGHMETFCKNADRFSGVLGTL